MEEHIQIFDTTLMGNKLQESTLLLMKDSKLQSN